MTEKDEIKKVKKLDEDTKRLIQELVKKEGSKRALKMLGTKEEIIMKEEKPKLSPETQERLNQQFLDSVREGKIDKVKDLIEKGADINAKDNNGMTALMLASKNNRKEIVELVELLIKNGADVNAKDIYGRTALMIASVNGHKEIVELLIKNGADVNAKK
jgi:ankyrin repeat protein